MGFGMSTPRKCETRLNSPGSCWKMRCIASWGGLTVRFLAGSGMGGGCCAAVAAVGFGLGGAETPVAAVAVAHGVPDRSRWMRRPSTERGRGRQLVGKPVGQEGGRAVQGLVREIGGQRVAYAAGEDVPLQPGRDAGREVGRVGGGQQQAGVESAQVGEEVDGGLEEAGSLAAGQRYDGERLAARLATRVYRSRSSRTRRRCPSTRHSACPVTTPTAVRRRVPVSPRGTSRSGSAGTRRRPGTPATGAASPTTRCWSAVLEQRGGPAAGCRRSRPGPARGGVRSRAVRGAPASGAGHGRGRRRRGAARWWRG